jgi:hypothetical protein
MGSNPQVFFLSFFSFFFPPSLSSIQSIGPLPNIGANCLHPYPICANPPRRNGQQLQLRNNAEKLWMCKQVHSSTGQALNLTLCEQCRLGADVQAGAWFH